MEHHAFIHQGRQGVEEAIASATGEPADLEEILKEWMLACFIDDVSLGYGWESFRMADYDTVSPGNRPGLDYTGIVDETPWSHPWHDIRGFQGSYYSVNDGLTGSLRAEGSGIGSLSAYHFDGAELTELDTGSAFDVALDLSRGGTLMLLCNSFAGLSMNVNAGSVGSGANFAVSQSMPGRTLLPVPVHGPAGGACHLRPGGNPCGVRFPFRSPGGSRCDLRRGFGACLGGLLLPFPAGFQNGNRPCCRGSLVFFCFSPTTSPASFPPTLR